MQLCDDHIIFNERTFLWKQSRVVPLPVLDLSQELQFVGLPLRHRVMCKLTIYGRAKSQDVECAAPKNWIPARGPLLKVEEKNKGGARRPNWMKHVLSCGFCFVMLGMPKSLWACFKVTLLSVQVDMDQVLLAVLSAGLWVAFSICSLWLQESDIYCFISPNSIHPLSWVQPQHCTTSEMIIR